MIGVAEEGVKRMYRVDESKCTGCGSCVEVCPVGAIELVDGKAHTRQEDCIECGACQAECENEAIFEV